MINPIEITDFNQNQSKLEEVILFWICAAGKNGVTSAKCLNNLLSSWREKASRINSKPSPFDIIRYIASHADLAEEMKKHGIGCYKSKSKSFLDLVFRSIDLKKCTLEDLESVFGIGPKTSRCFLIHSRKNQKLAGLDTHILKFLSDNGHEVPKSTPSGKKYKELEKLFLNYVLKSGMSVADFDLMIWNKYRNKKKTY
jgi:hypothetical protein